MNLYEGKMFGHAGFSIIGRYFCFAFSDGLSLKLHPVDYSKILKLEEAEPFCPRGTPMGTWVVLTYPDAEDYASNFIWIERAMNYIVTAEAAPPKKKRKPRTAGKRG